MAAKAVILLSGGLDSATVLAMARKSGFDCYAISFDYGQRHRCELNSATQMAASMGVLAHKIIKLDLQSIGGSALTDPQIPVPNTPTTGIPVTYVPARNTIFLSIALDWAEVLQAKDVFIGVNAVDYSGYPDCRPEFISAFENMANLATKAATEGHSVAIRTPLIDMSKAQIIATGYRLGVDYSNTVSCYDPTENGAACGLCEACHLRARGFKNAKIKDVTYYK